MLCAAFLIFDARPCKQIQRRPRNRTRRIKSWAEGETDPIPVGDGRGLWEFYGVSRLMAMTCMTGNFNGFWVSVSVGSGIFIWPDKVEPELDHNTIFPVLPLCVSLLCSSQRTEDVPHLFISRLTRTGRECAVNNPYLQRNLVHGIIWQTNNDSEGWPRVLNLAVPLY